MEFNISGRPIGLSRDRAYLRLEVKDGCTTDIYAKNESGLSKYQFNWETVGVYNCGIYNGILDLDPFAPLGEVTQGLSKLMHKAATNAFTNTMGNGPLVDLYKIVGMMRSVVIQGDACNTK